MNRQTQQPSQPLPAFSVLQLGGGEFTDGAPTDATHWTLLVVYRGMSMANCN